MRQPQQQRSAAELVARSARGTEKWDLIRTSNALLDMCLVLFGYVAV